MEKLEKILWFSRHEMTEEQIIALGPNVEIHWVNKTIQSAFELADEINDCDIIAIVAPVNLQAQFLKIAGDKPVIMAKSERRLVNVPGEEDKVVFHFVKWERLVKIDIVMEDYTA